VSSAPLEVVEAVEAEVPHTPPPACTNCGFEKVDVFCAKCGEKQPDHHDVTVGHFFHELFHELVHLDSKLFRTLRVLIVRPGELTADYFAGRKTRYITPLRLFITLFALQLIVYTIHKPVSAYSLETMLSLNPDPRLTAPYEKLAQRRGLTLEQFVKRVDVKWHKNLSLMQLANIFLAALVLKVLYRRRHLGEHMVFSAHYLSFAYIFSLIAWPIYFVVGLKLGPATIAVMLLSNLLMVFYFVVAIRRHYAQSLEKSILKGVLGHIGMMVMSMIVMYATLIAAAVQVVTEKA
jgi:Protein of unknown function (DUF3667)